MSQNDRQVLMCAKQELRSESTWVVVFFQNLDGVHNTADEMEMYGAVNRKFKQIFNRQEHMKTFKTYDRIEVGYFLSICCIMRKPVFEHV